MLVTMRVALVVGTCAGVALLAGCGGGARTLTPLSAPAQSASQASAVAGRAVPWAASQWPAQAGAPHGASWMNRSDAVAPLVYVSDFRQSNITVFGRDGSIQGKLTSVLNPQGMFVDSNRNLWVANTGGNDVLVFPRGATSPSRTLSTGNFQPVDVTICPNGTVYVSTILGPASSPGNIEVFAGGSTSPTGTLVDARVAKGLFLTCDRHNNVFWDFVGAGSASFVVAFPLGKQAREKTLPIALGFPGGIKPDDAGNLVINDQDSHTIAEYTEAGAATGLSIGSDPTADCVDIAVSRSSKLVGCSIFTFSGPPGGHTYSFPGGVSRRMYTHALSEPLGIAFDPAQKGLGR